MAGKMEQVVEQCIFMLKSGELTEVQLRESFNQVIGTPEAGISRTERSATPNIRQHLLYLFCNSTSLYSPVVGMSIYENGTLSDGPDDPETWKYKRVLDALNDGWRIIQFPVIVLLPMEMGQRYVPCEFILEKVVDL